MATKFERATPEPWLRASYANLHPAIAALLYSFDQAAEDVQFFAAGLSPEEFWKRPYGLPSAGFQLQHISGSIDRLLTYAEVRKLNQTQLSALQAESEPKNPAAETLPLFLSSLAAARTRALALPVELLGESRSVGRQELPATLLGLLVHIAEHTQRHVGQVITTAKLIAASR